MKVRWWMAAAFAAVALVVAGVLVYDARQGDRIAEGVRVGGVDVGGMTRAQAQRAVADRYARAVAHDVVVRWRGRGFALPASTSAVRLDEGATVDVAVTRSRGGNAFSRAWRDLTGGAV